MNGMRNFWTNSFLSEENEKDCWLQHDGMTVHTANTITASPQEFFGELICWT
jgi:hypothetical protein